MRNIFALFGKNKKRNKMEITENGLEEARSLYNGMEFQWIKGDDMMSNELFKDVRINGDNMFIEFQSGKRINSELLEEFINGRFAREVDFLFEIGGHGFHQVSFFFLKFFYLF